MKAILTDEEVKVYASMEDSTLSIATFHKGDEVDLGKVTRKTSSGSPVAVPLRGSIPSMLRRRLMASMSRPTKTETWVEVTLPNDQKGYIAGETKIFTIKRAQLASKSVDLHEAPDATSPVLKTYVKGDVMTVKGVEALEAGNWFKIVEEPNLVGYIAAAEAKLQIAPKRSDAIRNLVTGGIFAVIGIVLTLLNSDPTQQNGMSYISIAVIFFGLLQMGQGVYELFKVNKQKSTTPKGQ